MKRIFLLLIILSFGYILPACVLAQQDQNLVFKIETTRRKLPARFAVSMFSSKGFCAQFDIASYEASQPGSANDTLSGTSLEWSEKIFTLRNYTASPGEEFTINVSGHKLIWPAEVEKRPEDAQSNSTDSNAGTFSTSSDSTASRSNAAQSTGAKAGAREKKYGYDLVLVGDETDTLEAITVSGDDQSRLYVPTRPIGPYTTAFERHQVKLRADLKKDDDLNLLLYITSRFPGFMMVNSPTGIGMELVTTRGGSIRVTTNSKATSDSGPVHIAANETVTLYIDGFKSEWTEATNLRVRDVQNMYVLRGNEAALFSARAVIALELRRYDARDIIRGDLHPKSITIVPVKAL